MMSTYLSDLLIEVLFKNTGTVAALANVYVGLLTTPASCTSDGTEASGGSYARVAVAAANWGQNPAGGSVVQNNATVTFPAATGSWGTITGIGLYDASSSGNLLFAGPVEPGLNVTTGSVPVTFLAGQIIVDLCCCC